MPRGASSRNTTARGAEPARRARGRHPRSALDFRDKEIPHDRHQ
jgi:hypothetical protein